MIVDLSAGLASGLCGLGIVCSGLLLVAVVVAIRLGGRGLLPLLSMVWSRFSNSGQPEITLPQRRRVNLRQRAQSVDFDSALAAASQQPQTPPPAAPSRVTPTSPSFEPWADENGRQPRNEDEIFGGMLDVDGDGEPDL